MLLYIFCCPVFFLAKLVSSTLDAQQPNETVISDLLTNITRVNNILKQLIHSYEHLQNIHKSQENYETTSELLSFRQNLEITNNKINKSINVDKFPATIWSDMGEEKSGISVNYNEVPKTEFPISKLHRHKNRKSSTKKTKPTESDVLFLLSYVKTTLEPHSSSKQSKHEVTLGSSHEKLLDENGNKNTAITEAIKDADNKEPTFIIEHNRKKHRNKKGKHTVYKSGNDISKIKKKHAHVINSGENNSTVQNTTTSELAVTKLSLRNKKKSIEGVQKHKRKDKSLTLRSDVYKDKNSAIDFQNVTNAKKPKNLNEEEESDIKSSLDPTDDDESIAKDIFKTSVLRKAYGDACLKLVVKKCYKACKAAVKIVCMVPKCEKKFMAAYDRFSRTGCIQAFDASTPVAESSSVEVKGQVTVRTPVTESSSVEVKGKACKNTIKIICRTYKCKSGFKSVFKKSYKVKCDTVFAGMMYRAVSSREDNANVNLAAVCLPKDKRLAIPAGEGPNLDKTGAAKNLNILRAKYEKECIKTSREKCRDACKFAYTKACEGYECTSRRIHDFKKTCKRQCKISYVSDHIKSKSSSSSSSSDSTSSTSSESE